MSGLLMSVLVGGSPAQSSVPRESRPPKIGRMWLRKKQRQPRFVRQQQKRSFIAAEQLLEKAEAKLADAASRLKEVHDYRDAGSAGFERKAAEAAAIAAARAERERRRELT